MVKELENRSDVEVLVEMFYKKALKDNVIGYIFTEVAQLNLEKHLPVISDFWESVLFGKAIYKGNPMTKHIALNRKEKLTDVHFERWLVLWGETVNELFEGEMAQKAIEKAHAMKMLMQIKIKDSSDVGFIQ